MIAEEFDVFLFDLDGVVYIGENVLSGVVESIKQLRDEEKLIRFLTNNPSATRNMILKKLHYLGIKAEINEIVTSGSATAQYLKKKSIENILVLGNEDLKVEMSESGFSFNTRDPVEAVVVGFDETITIREIGYAAGLIRSGADFIATNADETFPMPEGPVPATGTIVRAIEVASSKKPFIVGKPSPTMFEMAISDLNKNCKAIMFGDTPSTDIIGAHKFGIPAILIGNESTVYKVCVEQLEIPNATIQNLLEIFDESLKTH